MGMVGYGVGDSQRSICGTGLLTADGERGAPLRDRCERCKCHGQADEEEDGFFHKTMITGLFVFGFLDYGGIPVSSEWLKKLGALRLQK